MNLLELPAELVRTILHMLEPESFYICLQTSKLFREHALASTSLLHDQLSRVPGPAIKGSAAGNAVDLVREFGKRATKHLKDGTSWMADVHLWRSSPNVDMKSSTITKLFWDEARGGTDRTDNLALVEVLPDATVNVYFLEKDEDEGHTPRLKHVISVGSMFEHESPGIGVPKVVKVAPYVPLDKKRCVDTINSPDPRLAVLYRSSRHGIDEIVWMKLVLFRLDEHFGPVVTYKFDLRCPKNEEVIAMAVTSSCEAIIVTRVIEYGSHLDIITVYQIEEDEITLERRTVENSTSMSPAHPTGPIYHTSERIAGISIHDKTVHLYPSTFPIPQWTIPWLPEIQTDRIERRDTHLPDIVEVFPKQSLGRAIAHHHHHMITEKDLNDGEPTCVNTALELMISRDNSNPYNSRTGAYLLKAIHYPSICRPFSLTADYPSLHHVFVAQLALPYSLSLSNLSTLGLKVAVSASAHRIAIASWRSVFIYSLDPQAFLDPEYSRAGEEGVPGDYAYIEGCGWVFYKSGAVEGDCVMLEPVGLKSVGVVFGLQFMGEDELWGWCELGIVRWRFGVGGNGRWEVSRLQELDG